MNAMKPPKPWNDPSTERSAMLAVRRDYPSARQQGVEEYTYRWKIIAYVRVPGLSYSTECDLSDVCNTTEEAWLMAASRLKGRK